MKRKIAIAALFIFFLAQFGRVINFCLCSIAVYQQTKTFTCDCEKQLLAAVKADGAEKHPAQSTIAAQQPTEELFHWSTPPFTNTYTSRLHTAWPNTGSERLHPMPAKALFRPPIPAC